MKTNNIWLTLPATDHSTNKPRFITGELVFKTDLYDDEPHLHARFYFDPTLWDVDVNGWIYGDDVFMNELHNRLQARGWHFWNNINYSESGMQDRNYVDMDVNEKMFYDLVNNGISATTEWTVAKTKVLA